MKRARTGGDGQLDEHHAQGTPALSRKCAARVPPARKTRDRTRRGPPYEGCALGARRRLQYQSWNWPLAWTAGRTNEPSVKFASEEKATTVEPWSNSVVTVLSTDLASLWFAGS
jgi:hypothetical protein